MSRAVSALPHSGTQWPLIPYMSASVDHGFPVNLSDSRGIWGKT